MKTYWIFLFLCLDAVSLWGQTILSCKQTDKGMICTTREGELHILPIADNAVRVRFHREQIHHFPQWIYVDSGVPSFSVDDEKDCLTVCLKGMKVEINKESGQIVYVSPDGKNLLKEDFRRLTESSVQGVRTFCAEQGFFSPEDEHLYGLGQFQDGYLDYFRRRREYLFHLCRKEGIKLLFLRTDEAYGPLLSRFLRKGVF